MNKKQNEKVCRNNWWLHIISKWWNWDAFRNASFNFLREINRNSNSNIWASKIVVWVNLQSRSNDIYWCVCCVDLFSNYKCQSTIVKIDRCYLSWHMQFIAIDWTNVLDWIFIWAIHSVAIRRCKSAKILNILLSLCFRKNFISCHYLFETIVLKYNTWYDVQQVDCFILNSLTIASQNFSLSLFLNSFILIDL